MKFTFSDLRNTFQCLLYYKVISCAVHGCCHVRLFVIPWTEVRQAPLSMGFSRQEYWSRLSFPSPRDLPNPEMEPISHASPALAGGFFTTAPPENPTCFRLVVTSISSVQSLRLFVTPWTVAHQAPLSMGFSRQEHWSGLPFPSPKQGECCI